MSVPTLRPAFTLLEKLLLVHLLGLLLGSSWLFGGNIWWMRIALSWWASGALILTIMAFLQPGSWGREARRRSWWLLPWLLFVLLVISSAFNPSFRSMTAEGERVLVHIGAKHPAWPSTVDPAKTLRELWFYAGVYLAAFNLLLIPRSRRFLRLLLVIGAANCLGLAIFGTLQKLMGAGLYFGASASPNPRFFATFLYNNHWGAFMILWLGAAAGLLFHYSNRHRGRDLWHSPFTGAVVGLLFIATSGPMSASRATTAMAAGFFIFVLLHGIARLVVARRRAGRPALMPVTAILLLALISVGCVGWLAQRAMNQRYLETRAALSDELSPFGGRQELYRDTWELAMRQPYFGWGFESYGNAFLLIRPRPVATSRQYESSYSEAHSDWLQSIAETGFVGTSLAVLMGLIPLLTTLRQKLSNPVPLYALLGCTFVLTYAWIEFPFANAAVLIAFWLLWFAACRHARFDPATTPPMKRPA